MTNRKPRQSINRQRISHTAENYLLSIAILEEDGLSPHISELASYLRRIPPGEEVGTTLASVSGMVQRMVKEGLIEVSQDKRILFTTQGQERARDVVRRHRLSERLLVDILDVSLAHAESEAHSLEHGISLEVLAKIDEKLGYPETCPYGRPIYREDEIEIRGPDPSALRLSEARPGASYTVTRIPDEDYPLLSYLVETEVLPGETIVVEDIAEYRGVVDISRKESRISLGMDVAARIRVRLA